MRPQNRLFYIFTSFSILLVVLVIHRPRLKLEPSQQPENYKTQNLNPLDQLLQSSKFQDCKNFLTAGHWSISNHSPNLPSQSILNLPQNKYGIWQPHTDSCFDKNYLISEIVENLKNLLIIGDSRARQYFRILAEIFVNFQHGLEIENFKFTDFVEHDDLRWIIINSNIFILVIFGIFSHFFSFFLIFFKNLKKPNC